MQLRLHAVHIAQAHCVSPIPHVSCTRAAAVGSRYCDSPLAVVHCVVPTAIGRPYEDVAHVEGLELRLGRALRRHGVAAVQPALHFHACIPPLSLLQTRKQHACRCGHYDCRMLAAYECRTVRPRKHDELMLTTLAHTGRQEWLDDILVYPNLGEGSGCLCKGQEGTPCFRGQPLMQSSLSARSTDTARSTCKSHRSCKSDMQPLQGCTLGILC
jgi:hypothetical protein